MKISIKPASKFGLLLCLFIPIWTLSSYAQQSSNKTGVLKGRIIDVSTKNPIPDVIVILAPIHFKTISDENGDFLIEHIPVGTFQISFSTPGYETFVKTAQEILPKLVTFLNVVLIPSLPRLEEHITVEALHLQKKEEEPLSQFNLNQNEIKSIPGTVGDISRALNILPSIARVNELSSDLIVRGGSPFENGFYIDGIPIPNINYGQREGGSGGALGIINSDLVENVNFFTGGFSAVYGDRLSSIVDLQFRLGSQEKISSRFDLNLAGFGVTFEGPIFGNGSSWIISGKRSYLDILSNALNVGIAPSFGNIHAKLNLNLNSKNIVNVLNIFAGYDMKYGLDKALENNLNFSLDSASRQNTFGITWKHIWSEKKFTEISLSHSIVSLLDSVKRVEGIREYATLDEAEQLFTLRGINFFNLSSGHRIEFGFEAKHFRSSFDNYFAIHLNRWGIVIPGLLQNGKFKMNVVSVFFCDFLRLTNSLTLNTGLRADYNTFNQNFLLSPRFSLTFRINNHLRLNLGTGIFFQSLYPLLLARNPQTNQLKDPRADHFIAGIDYDFDENTKITFEIYNKEYKNMPVTPQDPVLFILDNNVAFTGFVQFQQIADFGKAFSRGFEVLFQKRMSKKVSGIFSVSLFRARYRDYLNEWRDRLYDNKIVITFVGQYRPSNKWDLSLRWNFSGGIPYTPLSIEKSLMENSSVLDKEKILSERYPPYHSLFLKAEKRFDFKNSSLSIYLSLMNAYNRKNVARYYWNQQDQKIEAIHQFMLLPIFGMEYKF